MAAKKKTKKTAAKPATVAVGVATLDQAKTANAAAGPDAHFMKETQQQDRADAITKSVREALNATKKDVARAGKAIDLALVADDSSDMHQLTEMARRLVGDATTTLQGAITKGMAACKKAGVKW